MLSGLLFILCVVASVATAFAWWKKNERFFKLARKLPGICRGNEFIGNIIKAAKVNYDPVLLVQDLHKKSEDPGIIKFWRGMDLLVAISDPAYIQVYFTHSALHKRNDMYDAFDPWLGKDNILSAENEQWKITRKMMVNTFNATSPNEIIKALVNEANNMVQIVSQYADGDWFENEEIIARTSNRIFGKISVDKNIDDYKELTENLLQSHDLTRGIVLRVLSLAHYFNIVYPWTQSGRLFKKITTSINREMFKIIAEKKNLYDETVKTGNELPNLYVNNIFERCPTLSLDEITNQVVTMFGAGVDTTITSIMYSLTLMAMHPEIQEAVLKEDADIQERLGGRPLEIQDLQDYEYLERVIKEQLRMYPVFPVIGRVATDDVPMGKYIVPKGANVILCYHWTHRRADLFPNPLKFDPDRHLRENTKNQHPYAFQPFSAGGKTCIGSKFAMMTLKVVLSTFVRHYRIYTPYRSIEELDNNTFASVTLEDIGHCRLRIERRV